jgi:pyruvate,water dikinase
MALNIYDNSNLNESYAGVTTPLTYTFIRRVYRGVYIHFCHMMGVSENIISENEPLFSNMIEYLGGRVYYNIPNWYKFVSFLPGYQFNRKFFEQMLGVNKEYHYSPDPQLSRTQKYLFDFPKLIFRVLLITCYFIFMKDLVKKFKDEFNGVYFKELSSINLTKLTNEQLKELYIDVEKKLLRNWWIPIANDFAVMVSTGILRKLLDRWLNDKGDLFNILLSLGDRISIDPGGEILRLIDLIKSDKRWFNIFTRYSPPDIDRSLNESDCEISSAFKKYIDRFGDRVPGELKLESINFREDPTLFIKFLKAQLVTCIIKTYVPAKNNSNQEWNKRLNSIQKILISLSLKWSKISINRREECRFDRGLVFGFARRIFMTMGNILQTEGKINNKEDIFYLTLDELFSFSIVSSHELIQKVTERKNQEKYWNKMEMPRRVETDLTASEYNRYLLSAPENLKRKQSNNSNRFNIKGTVASKGVAGSIITGPALVLKEFTVNKNFKDMILVAPQTDPGWTMVFPSLRGVIVERGGLLSHAAIVAREYGIPCLIGVEDATNTIKDGSIIKLDVDKGYVSSN